jgi:hypothetical protein
MQSDRSEILGKICSNFEETHYASIRISFLPKRPVPGQFVIELPPEPAGLSFVESTEDNQEKGPDKLAFFRCAERSTLIFSTQAKTYFENLRKITLEKREDWKKPGDVLEIPDEEGKNMDFGLLTPAKEGKWKATDSRTEGDRLPGNLSPEEKRAAVADWLPALVSLFLGSEASRVPKNPHTDLPPTNVQKSATSESSKDPSITGSSSTRTKNAGKPKRRREADNSVDDDRQKRPYNLRSHRRREAERNEFQMPDPSSRPAFDFPYPTRPLTPNDDLMDDEEENDGSTTSRENGGRPRGHFGQLKSE